MLKLMALAVVYDEGRAFVEWMKTFNYLLVPEILAVRSSPVYLPGQDSNLD